MHSPQSAITHRILTLNSFQKAPLLESRHEHLKSDSKSNRSRHYHHHTKYHKTQSPKPPQKRTPSVANIPIKRVHILKDVRSHS